MVRQLRVRHGLDGWLVDTGAETCAFVSGSAAERWARALAERLANEGKAVELMVFDLEDCLAGAIAYGPHPVAA